MGSGMGFSPEEPYHSTSIQRHGTNKSTYLCEIPQSLGCGDGADDVTYLGDSLGRGHVTPERRVANDNELVVGAQSDAVDVRVGDHVRMEVSTAEKTCTTRSAIHPPILYTQ